MLIREKLKNQVASKIKQVTTRKNEGVTAPLLLSDLSDGIEMGLDDPMKCKVLGYHLINKSKTKKYD